METPLTAAYKIAEALTGTENPLVSAVSALVNVGLENPHALEQAIRSIEADKAVQALEKSVRG